MSSTASSSTQSDTAPVLSQNVLSAASGREMLGEISQALEQIGRGSKNEIMQQVFNAAPHHHEKLAEILELLPRATLLPVFESILALSDPHSGLPSPDAQQLGRLVKLLGVDPRSYREAVRGLSLVKDNIRPGSLLDTTLGRVLTHLDEKGVLGRKKLLGLSRFFVGIERRPGSAHLRDDALVVADETIPLHILSDFALSLTRHSPTWARQAVATVLYPQTQKYGAVREKVKLPLSQTLLVDFPAKALIPGRTVQRRWVRVDPLPPALKSTTPVADMAPYIELVDESSWRLPENKAVLEAVYAGFRVASAIVQPLWLSRLRLKVQKLNKKGNFAFYDPRSGRICVASGPLSAWSMVHELAHAIDDVLYDGDGFASEQPGNPLNAFTARVRPHYKRVADKIANHIWSKMLKASLTDSVYSKIRSKKLPLSDVLEEMLWIPRESIPAVDTLVTSLLEIEPSQVRELFPQGLSGGEYPMLLALQRSIELRNDGPYVDIQRGREFFIEGELQYLLSDREIFARFFDQYARIYLAQLGAPYGPAVRPGDLEPSELAALVPLFHEAMVEAQVLDLGHVSRFKSKELHEDTVAAVGVALGLVAIGAGFGT